MAGLVQVAVIPGVEDGDEDRVDNRVGHILLAKPILLPPFASKQVLARRGPVLLQRRQCIADSVALTIPHTQARVQLRMYLWYSWRGFGHGFRAVPGQAFGTTYAILRSWRRRQIPPTFVV